MGIWFRAVRVWRKVTVPACTPYPYTTGRRQSAGWDVKNAVVHATARLEDGHAAHEASDGNDDAGYAEVVEKASVQPAYDQ